MSRRWWIPCLALVAAAAWSPPARATNESERELRVLFVGNSFTRFHGLHRMVSRLAEADDGAPRIHTSHETRAGSTLRRHWIGRRALWRIHSESYTHVVLQGHSLRPIDRPAELATYARRFGEEIDATGARTVLYATWARREGSRFYRRRGDEVPDPTAMQRMIDRVYGQVARGLGADLAPVGDAWLVASRELPEIALHGRDGSHPTIAGSYLAACVLYATITGRSPLGIPWQPYPLEPDAAVGLQEIAASQLGE